MDFTIIKRGYSQLEVDGYIARLKNDYETRLSEQKDRIFYLKNELEKITSSSDNELVTSLVSAVERAKLIESSSKNIYELETKKLQLLYDRMEKMLSNPNIGSLSSIKDDLMKLIADCKTSLHKNIIMQEQNLKTVDAEDPVKRLLSKMMGNKKPDVTLPSEKLQDAITVADVLESPITTTERPAPVQPPRQANLEPFTKREIKPQPKKLGEFDQFLEGKVESSSNTFENIMFSKKRRQPPTVIGAEMAYPTPNESGFDLKAAVNPKEDLNEIMKAFDFFNDDDTSNKK